MASEGKQDKLYYSSSFIILAKALKEQLYISKNIFEKRYVVIPSQHMKRALMEFFAKGEGKISCGIEFIEKAHLLSFFEKQLDLGREHSPSKQELFLYVESSLRRILLANSEAEETFYQPLISYFPNSLTEKQKDKRLFQLSSHLTNLFLDYSLFEKGVIEAKWKASQDWQKQLFYELFYTKELLTYQKLLEKPVDENKLAKNVHLHFFSLSYLPPIYHQMFEKFSSHFTYSHYEFSPTYLYWGDESSDREIRYLTKKALQKDENNNQLAEVESYIYNRNPLVANLGKMGQKGFKLYDEKPMEIIDLFDDKEFVLDNSSILQQIQSDIFHLINPDEKRGLSGSKQDTSLALSITTTKKREIEELKRLLINLMETKKIKPSEILVLAPDIESFVSTIEEVFSLEGEKIPYRVSDIDLLSQSDFASALFSFLSLINGRFEKEALFTLFERPSFSRKLGFTSRDLSQLKDWANKGHVVWGMDNLQCQKELKTDQKDFLHTWEKGLERLLFSITNIEETSFSISNIELSNTALFSRFIKVFKDLVADVTAFLDEKELSLKDWSERLERMGNHYFQCIEGDQTEKRAYDIFLSFLKSLSIFHSSFEGEKFSFSLIEQLMKKSFLKKNAVINSSQLEAVRFQSLAYGSVYPSKTICLIGMTEECPGNEGRKDLDLMRQNPDEFDDLILKEQELSYSFLQAICQTKENLYLSYTGISKDDGKTEMPSFFISELFSAIDRTYDFPISEKITTIHPSIGFHHKYFDKFKPNADTIFSKREFVAARAHYHREPNNGNAKNEDPLFDFLKSYSVEKTSIVHIKDLQKLMKNPLQLFMNETLGIFLKEENYRLKEKDSLLALSHLDRYMIRQHYSFPFEELVSKLDSKGVFPEGMMGDVAKKELEKDYQSYADNLEEWNIKKDQVFSVSLQPGCYSPHQLENGDWVVPSIEIDVEGEKRIISGTITDVTPKGLLSWGEDKFYDHLRVWPSYLCYLLLENVGFSLPSSVLFMKKKSSEKKWAVKDPKGSLEKIIKYYDIARSKPSPLIKPLADLFYKQKESQVLGEKIEAVFQDSSQLDPYLQFVFSRTNQPNPHELIEEWGNNFDSMVFSQMRDQEI